LKQVAESCRVSEPSVRRLLLRAMSYGWLRPFCFVNHSALGLQTFNLLFSCPRQKHASVVAFLKADPRVVWAMENVGHPRYEVTAVSRTARGISSLFHDIAKTCNTPITSRHWALETSLVYWGNRTISNDTNFKRFELLPEEPCEHDGLDLRILDSLRSLGSESLALVARQLKESPSTISYRVNRLRSRKVISPVFYRLDTQSAGIFSCEYLLTVSRVEAKTEEQLIRFCDRTPEITMLVPAFGTWDYKLLVKAETLDGLLEVRDHLESSLPNVFSDVIIVVSKEVITGVTHFSRHPEVLQAKSS